MIDGEENFRVVSTKYNANIITNSEIANLMEDYVQKKMIKLECEEKFINKVKEIWNQIDQIPVKVKYQVEFKYFNYYEHYNFKEQRDESKKKTITLNTLHDFLNMYRSFGLFDCTWEHRNDDYEKESEKHIKCLEYYLKSLKRLVEMNAKLDSIVHTDADGGRIILHLNFNYQISFHIKFKIRVNRESYDTFIKYKNNKYIGTYYQSGRSPDFKLDESLAGGLHLFLEPLEFPENLHALVKRFDHWTRQNEHIQLILNNFNQEYKLKKSFDLDYSFPKKLVDSIYNQCLPKFNNDTIHFKKKSEFESKSISIFDYEMYNSEKIYNCLSSAIFNSFYNYKVDYIIRYIFDYWNPQDDEILFL